VRQSLSRYGKRIACNGELQSLVPVMDDDWREIMSRFNPKTRIVVLFDSCHSGTAMDLPYRFLSRHESIIESAPTGWHANVLFVSAGHDDQVSIGTSVGGVSTRALIKSLGQNSDLDIFDLVDTMNSMSSALGHAQIAQVSASFDITLREHTKLFMRMSKNPA